MTPSLQIFGTFFLFLYFKMIVLDRRQMDNSAERSMVQFWELSTMISCAPKDFSLTIDNGQPCFIEF